jgi:spore coat protein CotH
MGFEPFWEFLHVNGKLGLACAWLAAYASLAAAETDPPGSDIFGNAKLHAVQLTIGAKEYAAMEPPPPKGPFGAPRAGGLPPGSPDAGAGNFGFEFEYVSADVMINGRDTRNIGLRYKGSGTYLISSRAAKRSFKLDFDRFDEQQRFAGLKKLNLNSGAMDPTKVREACAYRVFQAAGLPASRTAFAEVSLTVAGKYDQEYLGVYTVVEQVDKPFLKTHFKNAKGLLLKPEGIRGLPYLGDNAAAYEKLYNAKSGESEEGWQRLIELTRLVNREEETRFREKIGTLLDVEGFARFLAASSMLATLDGFTGMGHNYYLYLSPETNKFHFFPWDLDLAFGGFFLFGSPDQQADLSIEHPHVGDNKLIDRLLAMPDFKASYRKHLQRLHEEIFSSDKFAQEIDAVEKLVQPLVAKEKQAVEARKEAPQGFGPPAFGAGGPAVSLKDFVKKRSASVAAQLAGRTQAFVPLAMGFGGPPPGAGPGNLLAMPLLRALDANQDGRVTEEEFAAGAKKLFRDWDRDRAGSLDQQEIEAGLQRLAPRPMGPPPMGPQPMGR